MSWEQAWQEGRTGWDAGEPVPALVELLEDGVHEPGRALVPGAGSGWDALALAEAGWEVVALDVSPTAVERFEALRDARGARAEGARGQVADFFAWRPDAPFDLVWDYTFLCAIDPSMRPDWARAMSEYVAPGKELVTLIFPVDPSNDSETGSEEPGPPFRLHPDRVRDLLDPWFELVSLEAPRASHPGREGKEFVARWRRRGGE